MSNILDPIQAKQYVVPDPNLKLFARLSTDWKKSLPAGRELTAVTQVIRVCNSFTRQVNCVTRKKVSFKVYVTLQIIKSITSARY